MRTRIALACSCLVLAAQTVPPPPGPPPPPPAPHAPLIGVSRADGVRPTRRMLAWMPGEVRCGATPVAAVQWRRPYQALAWSSLEPKPVTYAFRLDASGRPLSIARAGVAAYVFGGEDIAPSLAASRFAAGAERRDCSVTYTPRTTTFADTPAADLVSYTLTPTNGPLPPEGWAAIFPAATTCKNDPKPAPLTQIYPDRRAIAGSPGHRDWTLIGYDTDASGAPTAAQVLSGTGNAALEAAGIAAIRASRYTEGPRTGCRLPFVQEAEILAAPPIAAKAPGEPKACEGAWATKPPLRYPTAYRRRSIEGWAVIGFDIAPWGATGNVRVLAAEPAAEFGEQAAALIREAKRAPSAAGVSGCIERVHFRMGRPGDAANTEDADS